MIVFGETLNTIRVIRKNCDSNTEESWGININGNHGDAGDCFWFGLNRGGPLSKRGESRREWVN